MTTCFPSCAGSIFLLILLMASWSGTALAQAKLGPPISPPEVLPQPKPKVPDPTELTPLDPFELVPVPAPVPHGTLAAPETELSLDRVLASVEQHYPLLLAVLRENEVASGKFLSAQGQFDLNLSAYDRVNTGSYENHRLGIGFTQPFAFQGLELGAGYRLGAGEFPVYYGEYKTAEGGEFALGLTVPLLRNRLLDARRANLQKAQLDVNLADPIIQKKRLAFFREASLAYWSWVAAGHRFLITKDLLRIAELREEFLLKRLKAGAEDRIEVLDNRRLIVDRRARLVKFQKDFEQTSITLSMFLRDPAGNPIRPDTLWKVPPFEEPGVLDPKSLPQLIEYALTLRPELQDLQLQRQKLQVDVNLAKNQTLPGLNVVLNGAQDVGQGKETLDRYTYQAGVILDVPLQRRDAKGKILTSQAKIAQVNSQEQYYRDRIATEVQNAVVALVRAREARLQAKHNVELNRALEIAEIKKRDLGKSNILLVNLRELSRADAQLQEISALAEYFAALADYYAVLGTTPPPTPGSPHPKN